MLSHDRTHKPFSSKENVQTNGQARLFHRPSTSLPTYEAPTLPLLIDHKLLLIILFSNVSARAYVSYPSRIRRDLSGSGLLTIVYKRFLIRELEDRFESQSRASRSGIALGVSPSGVSPQVVDHRLESATIPRPIAIAKGAKQLREGVGGGH